MNTKTAAPPDAIEVDIQSMSLEDIADVSDQWDEYDKNKGRTLMDALSSGDFRAIAHMVAHVTGMSLADALALPMARIRMIGAPDPEAQSGDSGVGPASSRANGH